MDKPFELVGKVTGGKGSTIVRSEWEDWSVALRNIHGIYFHAFRTNVPYLFSSLVLLSVSLLTDCLVH